MSDQTKIEWCDASWSPVIGCTPIPEEPDNPSGCSRCYARRMIKRFWRPWGLPSADPGPVLRPDKLEIPYHWKKPRRIFVCSMSDLWHEKVNGAFINQVWNVAFNNPRHTFIFLTKRPDRLKAWTDIAAITKHWPIEDIWPSWMWIGTTAENQRRLEERAEILVRIPAAVRFLSLEPLLGPVDVEPYFFQLRDSSGGQRSRVWDQTLHWVVCGSETGSGKRDMKPEWACSIKDQCQDAGVPFFFKKNSRGTRLLDGREWNQYPGEKR